jgi:hypothetical protein
MFWATREISSWIHDLARHWPVRPPIGTGKLKSLFHREDFAGMIGAVKSSFGLDMPMVLGRVHSGGSPTAPAWIQVPTPMPLYGTEAFRRTTFRVFVRTEFMRWMPFSILVPVMAHEMAHVVLSSTYNPLRDNEKAVDLTAMLFGYADLYVEGTTSRHRFGYLSRREVRRAARIMKKLRA